MHWKTTFQMDISEQGGELEYTNRRVYMAEVAQFGVSLL